jgi:hypothetical protein
MTKDGWDEWDGEAEGNDGFERVVECRMRIRNDIWINLYNREGARMMAELMRGGNLRRIVE